ncbi:MAG TPA: hypothetical protein VFQ61_02525 [Polyangiaceae bacterium]|nr:hypothetical protein [Polyangiaceae bacterium]
MKFGTLCRTLGSRVTLTATLLTAPVSRAADVNIRVHGQARVDATARSFGNTTEVSGSLMDERGRAVVGRVSVRKLTATGRARTLSQARPCSPSEDLPAPEPSESADEARVRTDGKGRFCLQLTDVVGEGQLQVSFDEPKGWLERTAVSVEVARTAPLKLAFRALPSRVAAESADFSVIVEARAETEGLTARPATLGLARSSNAFEVLERATLIPGQDLHFTVNPKRLGEPGAIELVAESEVDGERVRARAPMLVTGRATVKVLEVPTADSQGESSVSVGVTSSSGPITTGSVEARVGGRTVGIAAVAQGRARVLLALGATPGPVRVGLRYLPASPYWVGGEEQEIVLTVPEPSVWRKVPGLLSGCLIALWILAAWRRPPRREVPTPAREPVPKLEWLPGPPGAQGFAGSILDAHDGTPIVGAQVSVFGPSISAQHATSDAEGHFELEPPSDPRGVRIRVESNFHRALEQPLPRPGRLSIALVTRRRALLAQFVEWCERVGLSFPGQGEPTPAELARRAQENQQPELARWADAVETAAFGPSAVDADYERRVELYKPSHRTPGE